MIRYLVSSDQGRKKSVPMRILWVSKHKPTQSQRLWFLNRYGDVTIVVDTKSFSSAEEIIGRYKHGAYDDIVVVASLIVIAKLISAEIHPLWPAMYVVPLDQAEYIVNDHTGKHGYRFNRFRRIEGIALSFED